LYDIEADRTESNNLAAEHANVVRELAEAYDAWAARSGVVSWDQIEPHRPPPATRP
jgi:hypothetical protein